MRPFDAEVVEELDDISGQVGDGARTRRRRRTVPVTPVIDGDDAEPLSQSRNAT
jgi:hypothetical protein